MKSRYASRHSVTVSEERPSLAVPGSPTSSRDRAGAVLGLAALFAVSLVIFGVGYATQNELVSLIGVFGSCFFGVGTSPTQHRDCGLSTRIGVAGLVSLSVVVITGSLMALIPFWHPLLVAALICSAAALAHALACARLLPEVLRSRQLSSWKLKTRIVFNTPTMCTAAGSGLWISAAVARGKVIPGVGGFLTQISPTWYLGLALLLLAIITPRDSGAVRAIPALISLIGALTITPALLYGMPPLAAAKHIDIVQFLLHAHYLDRNQSIYYAYSGLFSAVAWICDLAMSIIRWY